jgi:hypothetical protein
LVDKTAVTFDPYMFLTLPIPQKGDRFIELILLPRLERPRRYAFNIPKTASVGQAKDILCKQLGWTSCHIYEAWKNKVYKTFDDGDDVSWSMKGDDVYALETNAEVGMTDLPVYFTKESQWSSSYSLFGAPIWIRIVYGCF